VLAWQAIMKVIVLIAGGVLISCTTSPDEVNPGKLHSGIYELQISTAADTCEPPRTAGNAGHVGVFVSALGIGVLEPTGIPFGSSYQRYDLVADAGYEGSVGAGINAGLGCGGQSTFSTVRQLISATTAGFAVTEATDWIVTVPCAGGVVSEIPAASCHDALDLNYQLVTACDPPCQLRSSALGLNQFTCECPAR
jgi:hypothetical protein